jgi:CubicO group peptidase (beta-lactamase class C family)
MIKEIEFLFTPGTSWQYSGGGYTIIQMALEDTLINLLQCLHQTIFSPIGMNNTTMIQPNEMDF